MIGGLLGYLTADKFNIKARQKQQKTAFGGFLSIWDGPC
jgi:hypothetical protein